jgi:phage terminase Nu1 subunit (DNA packaging protein)
MKKFKEQKAFFVWLFILTVFTILPGCSGGVFGGGSWDKPVVSIVLTPATASIPVTGTQQFSAIATYSDGAARDVTASSEWKSATPAVATIAATGIATGVTVGSSVITANFGGKTASATVTVNIAVSKGLKVTPAASSLPVTGTLQYTVIETFSDGSTIDRTAASTWSAGTVGVTFGVTKGFATGVTANVVPVVITATYGIATATATLTVNAATSVSFTVTPATTSVPVTGTRQYMALETFSDGSTIDRTAASAWTAPDLVGVGVATILPNGLATAVAAGQSTITAKYSGKTATAVLTVNAVTSVSFTVTPATTSVPVTGTRQYAALETFSDGSTIDRTAVTTWTAPDLVGVGVATILPTGLATAVAAGQSTITANYSGKTATAILTVNAVTSVSLIVTPSTTSVPVTGTRQYMALETFSDGSTIDRTAASAWTAPDLVGVGVATILPNGLATAVAAGQSTITAKYSGKTATAVLTVNAVTSVSFTVTPATTSVPVTGTRQYTALETFSDGSTIDRTAVSTWTAPDSVGVGVATILPTGLATAVAAGQSTITANYGGKTATAILTVNAVTSKGLKVTPIAASVPVSGAQQFMAIETFSDGSTIDRTINAATTWTTSTANASLSLSGVAGAGLATGVTITPVGVPVVITATYGVGGPSATANLTVTAATLKSFKVTPATALIAITGGTQQFSAFETMSDGSIIDRTTDAATTWTSVNFPIGGTSVSTIGLNTGLATGNSIGQSTITATYGLNTATAILTVTVPNYGPAGAVNLGTAGTYGVMANSAMTLSAPAKSHIYGDVGILATDTFTGFTLLPVAPPSAASPTSPYVTGQITSFTYNTVNRAAMVIAFNDLQSAWTNYNTTNKKPPLGVTLTPPLPTSPLPAGGTFSAAGQDMTGMILGPGIYASNTLAGTLALSNASGPLVLDALGNADAVFIFQASDMTTTSGSVILRNGAQSKNIYWVLTKTATIGDGTTATSFQGTILAGTAVTVGLDTSVQGRVLAGAGLVTGALTINGGVITVP